MDAGQVLTVLARPLSHPATLASMLHTFLKPCLGRAVTPDENYCSETLPKGIRPKAEQLFLNEISRPGNSQAMESQSHLLLGCIDFSLTRQQVPIESASVPNIVLGLQRDR